MKALPLLLLAAVTVCPSLHASPPRQRTTATSSTVVSRPLLLGRSENGRPINALRSGDPHAARVLVFGCIHGSECAGIAIARALERVRAQVDLWIVPDLNPDGYALGTRQNGRGVDLNANWLSQWQGGGRPWDTYYPARVPSRNGRRGSRAS